VSCTQIGQLDSYVLLTYYYGTTQWWLDCVVYKSGLLTELKQLFSKV
jgi:hypothetical protein